MRHVDRKLILKYAIFCWWIVCVFDVKGTQTNTNKQIKINVIKFFFFFFLSLSTQAQGGASVH